jgi:thiol-disulfide isomerase/thioredoxin
MPWSHTCPKCREEWFPAPSRSRAEMLGNLERALNGLANIEVVDEQVRSEIDDVERAVSGVREMLYRNRWI